MSKENKEAKTEVEKPTEYVLPEHVLSALIKYFGDKPCNEYGRIFDALTTLEKVKR